MITDRDVVCLSSQDWTEVWTRKQRFMQRLARQGNRVLYVNMQASWASIGYLRADWKRPLRWLAGPRPVEQNLRVATLPLAIPGFQMALGINAANTIVMRAALRAWIRQLHFVDPVLWTYNPYSDGIIGHLGESCAIYECVDEFAASKGLVRAPVVQELERRVISAADAVIVTHENLYRSKSLLARRIHLIPNAAETEHFAKASDPATAVPEDLRAIRGPIVGVVGTLQYWIDFALIRYLAEQRPQWSFVLIGPKGRLARMDLVEGMPNVHLMGRRPYASLPAYVRGFDVCLNPYILDDTALNCSPLKLYEYVASGRPVVSVEMPEARKFADIIGIGRSYEEVLARLEDGMKPEALSAVAIAARIRAAAAHSWEARFVQMEQALGEALAKRSAHATAASTFAVPSAAARHE